MMLAGPYGCGKTTLAWLIAKFMQGWDFEGQPQAQEINGANYRKIDDMRKLAEGCGAYPMVGKYGVIIMDEAQQLTKDAQQILREGIGGARIAHRVDYLHDRPGKD